MPSNETANERFERLAAAFYDETGLMAPGKDVPAELGALSTLAARTARWKEWLSAQSTVPPSPAAAQEAEPKAIGRVRGAVEYARARAFHSTRVQTADLDVLLAELSESRARAVQDVLAEREACAKIADELTSGPFTSVVDPTARRIAQLIRARTSPSTPDTGRNDSDAQ